MAPFGCRRQVAHLAQGLFVTAVLPFWGSSALLVVARQNIGLASASSSSAGSAQQLVGKWREVSADGYPVPRGADTCQYFANHRYHCTGHAVQKAPPGTWSIIDATHIRITAYGATFKCSYSVTLTTLTTRCGASQGTQKYRRVTAPSPSPTRTFTPSPTATSTLIRTPTGKTTLTPTGTLGPSTPTPGPTRSATSTPVPTYAPTPTPSHSSIVGTWVASSINGKKVPKTFQTCQFFESGSFSCTGHNATRSAYWSMTGNSRLVLSAKGHSVDCSYSLSGATLSIDCGNAGSDTYTRVTPAHPGVLDRLVRFAVVPFTILGGMAIVVAFLVILGRTSPPSRKRP